MKQNRILLCVVLFLMIFNILVPVLYAQPLSEMGEEERNQKIKKEIERVKKEREKYKHPKVSMALVKLEEAYKNGAEEAAARFLSGEVMKDEEGKTIATLEVAKKQGAEEAAEKFAEQYGLRIKEGRQIRVLLILKSGFTAETIDKSVLYRYGGAIGKGSGNRLQAEIPIDQIRKIADEVEWIERVDPPNYGVPLSYLSEGVSLTDTSPYYVTNNDGAGIKLSIIDLGFAGLSSAISSGDIPDNVIKVDCTPLTGCRTDSFSSETEKHGTAVAEIVHDMAPGAQLYLIKIADTDDLKLAKDYCINPSNGINVINHSVGWFNHNFYDGACLYGNAVCTADSAHSNGILWVNASGNHAKKHYQTTYTDRGFGWHTYAANDSMAVPTTWAEANKTISMHLTWDAWPITNQDYDMYLFDANGGSVAESIAPQTGTETPTESLFYKVPIDGRGDYYLFIIKNSTTQDNEFSLYSGSHEFEDSATQTVSSSLLAPADAATVLTVGAIDYTKWTTGTQEDYSSQGPPNNSIIKKPDITGPDGVSTYSYGARISGTNCITSSSGYGFCGTSAAAPHVTGAAALLLSKLKQQYTSDTASQLRDRVRNSLTSSAITMGNGIPNNVYGYGRLQLPALYIVNVTKTGTGSGTVTSNITGINCGSKCSDSFISGSTVTLTATPDAGSLFQWSGACSGQSCQITMNGDKAATATFYLPTLSVSKTGAGNGTITSSPAGVNCGATCSANYNAGTLPYSLISTGDLPSSLTK